MIFGFYNGAEKKISSTNYAAIDIDLEESRVYFVETDGKEGWKFTGSKNVRELSLTIYDSDVWMAYEGQGVWALIIQHLLELQPYLNS